MGLDFDPWFAAEHMGIPVGERRMRHGRRGEYDHATGRIWLAPGLAYRVARATLTHELMHAHAGDVPSPVRAIVDRQERLARRRTASTLIDPDEYAEAELLREGWVAGIALDLDVTTRVVLDWQEIEAARRDRAA